MTPDARIAATIELLDEIIASERPADAVVAAYFRRRRYIGAKDRGNVAERIYATLRHHARLGWWLARTGHADSARARVIAELVLAERMSANDVAARFSGRQYAPAPLTGAEDRLAAALATHTPDHPDMAVAVRGECPDWAAEPLQARFGDRVETELAGLLRAAPLDLRVNELKGTSPADVAARLADVGVEAAPTPLSPVGLRVRGRPPLAGQALFRGGTVEVQDEGSQLVALLADVRPGHQVVDFCAGAGGKALAMAARMGNKGRVVACDVSERRLIRARQRLRRAGADNIEPKLLTSERDRWVNRQKCKFDRVLVDAPCSGTGAWRRHPDARWRPVDLVALTALQDRILASAARLVKPGGRLIYATCSLLPAENDARVAAFLDTEDDFTVVPVTAVWGDAVGGECPSPGPYLHLTPARHGTDGFFAAVLERRTSESAEPAGGLSEIRRSE